MPATELDEARIAYHVREALAHTPGVDTLDVTVEVVGGLVTLTGTVDTLQQKLAAGQAAQSAPGVVMVENKLAVTTQGDLRATEIREELDRAAAAAGGLPGMTWELEDSVVHLGGVTDSIASAQEAEAELAAVPGVKRVERHLEVVGKGLPTDDASLKSRVEEALHADPATALLPIEVAVQDGVVTLMGRVSELGERRQAAEVARRVPGVGHLINRVVPETGETGGEPRLEHQVRAALAREKGLDERRILVTAARNLVFLGGEVRSPDDRARAEEIAAAVPGVAEVVNDIQVVSEYRA